MFVVIFEVRPKPERFDDYLNLAGQLKPRLEAIDGFIENERYRSQRDAGRLLSLSTWRDEKALVRWRTQGAHHAAQMKGRSEIFADYHLRIGEVTFDTQPPRGLPITQSRFDETEAGDGRAATITEPTQFSLAGIAPGPDALATRLGLHESLPHLAARETFESITNPGKRVVLASWRSAAAAADWMPIEPPSDSRLRHRQVRIIRDYGMFDRQEAPQYYPPVELKPSS